MRTLGLIGGTGWVSTIEYYRLINQLTNERLGGLNAAQLILYSVNYAEIDKMNQRKDNLSLMATLKHLSRKLEAAGADGILICANTLHRFADDVQQALRIPIINIAEVTAEEVRKSQLKTVGLLGTKTTMELDFYPEKLAGYQIKTVTPEPEDRDFIQQVINEELLKERFLPESKQRFLEVIQKLIDKGAEGIILGCTEIPLLVKPADVAVPVFNTTEIHTRAAVNYSIG